MELSEVLQRLVSTATKAFVAGGAAVWLLDETGSRLTAAAGYGVPQAFLQQDPLPLGNSPLAQEALAQGAALVTSAVDDPRQAGLPVEAASALAVPLGPGGRPSGILCVYGARPHQFDLAQAGLLHELAELGGAALAATHALADLEQIEAGKSEFIRVSTHELRSPITVSQSLVRTVLKGYAGPLTDKQKDVFKRISGQLNSLESLVNDLLDLAASQAPELAASEEPVALNSSVARAVLLLQPRAEEKGVTLNFRQWRGELAVWATEEGLDRIFVNLVGNAVKYTPADGEVTVSLQPAGQEAQVIIADTGIGIPAEAAPHLFEEFYRASNARTFNAVGTGLGLAIVKRLVDQFKGRIAVVSTEGQGATFTVGFPLYRPAK